MSIGSFFNKAGNIAKGTGKIGKTVLTKAHYGTGIVAGITAATIVSKDKNATTGKKVRSGLTAGAIGATSLSSAAVTGVSNSILGAANPMLGTAVGLTALSIKVPKNFKPTLTNLNEIKFSKTGIGLLGVVSAANSLKEGYKAFKESRQGENIGYRNATPNYQKYMMNDCGATGDLVFAMNNNRRG